LSGLDFFLPLEEKSQVANNGYFVGDKNENAKTPDSKNSMSTQEKRGGMSFFEE
jgi:hypothetical protein